MNALAGPLFVILGVLIVAGAAKLARPHPTAGALRSLGVPAPVRAARSLGATEILAAVTAALTGNPVAFAAVTALYAGFALFVLWALGSGATVSCGCFGRDDTPPTAGHVAFNAAAATVAGLAVADPVSLGDFDGSGFAAVVFAALVGVGVTLAILALTTLPRLLALVHGTGEPAVPTFTTKSVDAGADGHAV